MSNLREWFAGELQGLGWAGLEGVLDYVAEMDDSSVREYMKSLIGADERSVRFIESYLSRRKKSEPASVSSAAPSANLTAAATTAAGAGTPSRGKKGRRGRSNQVKTKASPAQSFASAASRGTASASQGSDKGLAPESAVELSRRKVREYRRERRTVNCIKCGKIEEIIAENGACTFCQSPIFSIWEGQSNADSQSVAEAKMLARAKRSKRPNLVAVVDLNGEKLLDPKILAQEKGSRPCTGTVPGEPSKETFVNMHRPMYNPALPGGGPKFLDEYAEQLDRTFSVRPELILPSSGIFHVNVHATE